MAQLKDSVVSGNLRVSDTTLSATVQLTTLRAPTTAGGTTYGPGTNGQVLKTNGTSSYWGVVDKIGSSTVGGTYLPIYLNAGTPTAITVKNNTSKSAIGWTSGDAANASLVTLNSIAYWNGCYSGTSSNLEYCVKGAFGTIVTKSTTDYSKVSISRNLTSGTKIGTITIDGTSTDLYCQTNTNTDTKVTQTATSTSDFRPIVLGYTHSTTPGDLAPSTAPTDQVYVTTKLYMQPTSGDMYSAGAIILTTSACGLKLTDSDGNAYAGIWDNGHNLWIGATQAATSHHVGQTFISSGYDSANSIGYDTIRVSVPNATNDGATNYYALHDGNTSASASIASTATGAYQIGTVKIRNTTTTFYGVNTNTWTAMVGATSSANGTAGYVGVNPPKDGYNTKFWRADGSWAVPTNTTYGLSGAYAGTGNSTWVTTLTAGGSGTTSTVPTASTTAYGITKLSTATNSTSTALAATASAVKEAYDLANGKSVVTASTSTVSGATTIKSIKINNTNYNIYDSGNTDTKVNVKLATTTKAYLLATTTTPTSSAQAVTSVGDTGVYLTTSDGGLHATTFEGSLNGSISVIETHGDGTTPTTQKTYYVPFMVDKQGTNYIRANDGIRYATYDGDTTTSPKTPGVASLRLGNSKTLDDTGNMRGSILLFGSGANYVQALPTTLTADRTIYFPDEGGTIALKTQADTSEMINLLSEGSSIPADNDFYVSQYANGGTTTTTYHRRSVLALWQYMKSKMTNGSNVSFSTDSTTKVLTISASNDKVTSTALEASTTEATYYPTFSTSSSTNTAGLNKISSFKVIHTPGTASAVGNTRIILGNTTASGTANNEEGLIRLYSSGTSYHTFQGAATNASGGVTHTFPATAGTVLNTGTTSYTATITSSATGAYAIGTLKINGVDNVLYGVDAKVRTQAIAASTAEYTYGIIFSDAPPNWVDENFYHYVHLTYKHTPGTASAEGFGTIALGNGITTGTLGNETGRIYLYSPGSKGHYIQGASTSVDRTHTLPATTGTILNTGTTSFTQIQTSGTKIGSIKINNTSTDIYSPQAGNVGLYSIIGTIEDDPAYGSHATCNWGGSIPVAELYDGLTIAYCLQTSVSPSANVTINLKLSNGTYTGRINAYTTASSRITTHYGAGSTIILTYWSAGSISVDGTVTTLPRWARADYNYNSDAKVTQSVLATSVTDSYPLLLSYYKHGVTTTTAQSSNRIQAIYAQPSTGIITANGFEMAAQTELDSKSVSGSNNVTLTNSNLGRYSIIMLVLVNSGTNDTYYRAQMIPYKWLKATFTNTSMKYHVDLLDTLTGGSAYISGSSALATQITIGLSSGSWPSGYSTLKLIGVM